MQQHLCGHFHFRFKWPLPEPENAPSGQSSLIGLICFGVIVLVGGTVLAIGLAASRPKKLDSD